jgi:uncharacterized phage-associated protein
MLARHEREKLINAIIYFGKHTRKCGITKLFKLLYFLDFEHYRATGRCVTGLDYYAWKMGPVPVKLYNEVPIPDRDLAEKVSFAKIRTARGSDMFLVKPKAKFDPSHFTRRELDILKDLAEEYKDSNADDIIEKSHLETLPWYQVYEVEQKKQKQIPYDYALRKGEEDMVKFMAEENREVVDNYK